MENASFDDLLQAVRTAYVEAQDSLRKRREEAARLRSEELEAAGRQGPSLTFAIPRNGGAEDAYDALTLPLSSFWRQRRPQVAMLSLSFECELEEEGFRSASRVFWVVIAPDDKTRLWRKKRKRMQIVFHGTEQPCGEVRLDGHMLLPIPARAVEGQRRSTLKAQPWLFAKVFGMFRKLWPRHGFVMTVEQSQRVRQMLARQDAAATPHGGVAL